MSLTLPLASGCAVLLLGTLLAGFAAAQPEKEPAAADEPAPRPRVREAGITVGVLPPGRLNAITDVAGVRVGHRTIVEGDSVRTGVTAVVPHDGNLFQHKVPAAIAVGNGFGKLVGVTQIQELGRLETPIVLTNTLSAFTAADAVVTYTLKQPGNERVLSVNPLAGECNDGYLNDIRARRVTQADVLQAIDEAKDGPVAEGSVGAGTGMRCLGWKGGIGTSSRKLPEALGSYTLGVLVQTNFGGVLNVAGAPVGQALGRYYLKEHVEDRQTPEQGSCIVVVATDAPLDARQLERLARRAILGLAAVGSPLTHGSGDYVIAFSTDARLRSSYISRQPTETATLLRDDALSPLFQAAREATEEAVLNSLFQATTVIGHHGRTSEAIPIDQVIEVCKQHAVIKE
jgi:D-aminopeptidase